MDSMTFQQVELRDLRYFLAVLREGSFTAGARTARITQPALSNAIKLLEERLGVPLFERLERSVRPTAAGEAFARHAQAVLLAMQDAETGMAEFLSAGHGRLAMGVVQTVNACLVPALLPPLLRRFPGAEIHVEELSAGAIETQLLRGDIDVGVGFLPVAAASLEGEPLAEEDLCLYAAPGHRLVGGSAPTPADLTAHRVALLGGQFCTRRLVDAWVLSHGVPLQPQVTMNSIEGLLELVAASDFVTILPSLAAATRAGQTLERVPLPAGQPRRTLGLMHRRGSWRGPLGEAFCEALRDALAEVRAAAR